MFKRTGNGSPSAPARGIKPRRPGTGWTCAALGAALVVSACTASSVLAPRPEVDVGMHTAAVSPAPRPSADVAPAMQPLPAPETTVTASALDPVAAPATDPETGLAPGPRSLGTLTMTQAGGEMTPVPASALEPASARMPAPMSAPMSAPESPAPTPEPERPVQVAAMPAPAPQAPEPRPAPTSVGYPRLSNPGMTQRAPEPLVVKPVMPADEAACRRALKRIGATFTDIPRIGDGGSCGIDWPVRVTSLSGNIRMQPAAKLTCEMALTFAKWTKNELAPAARTRYLSGIKRINNGTYSCRRIAGSRTMSSHSKGNAIDIMSIDLENGRNLDVRKPGFFAFRQRGLLNTVRADGCSYFTTVLGPGYNYDHRNHFHFDLMQRKSGHRACH